MRRPFWRYHSG